VYSITIIYTDLWAIISLLAGVPLLLGIGDSQEDAAEEQDCKCEFGRHL